MPRAALAQSEEYDNSLRLWRQRSTEWDNERLQLRQQLSWFESLLYTEKNRVIRSEETAAGLRRQLADLHQEGSALLSENARLQQNHLRLQLRNSQLESATAALSQLEELRTEATRARDSEQRLREEREQLRLVAEGARDLEELLFLQRDEIETLSKDQCRAELAVWRLAGLEESLDEARDTIKELKEYAEQPTAEISRIREQSSSLSTMEATKSSDSSVVHTPLDVCTFRHNTYSLRVQAYQGTHVVSCGMRANTRNTSSIPSLG